jgi:hypothetical protein
MYIGNMSETHSFINVSSNVMSDAVACLKKFHQQDALLLDCAFKSGAYVAGGTARKLYNDHLSGDLDKFAIRELFSDSQFNRSDIDVFFPSMATAQMFIHLARALNCRVEKSLTGYAMNIDMMVKNRWSKSKYQAIILERAIGDIHDVLQQFDIFPSMVALNYDGFIIPKASIDLDEKKVLHVQDIKTPFTLMRIAKYLQKYGYKTLDDESSDKVVDITFDYIGNCRKGTPYKYIKTNWKYEEYKAINNCKQLVCALSTPALVKTAFLFGNEAYNNAFNELDNRSKKNVAK